jgi:hypothetical protein
MFGIFLAFVASATALLICLNAETLGRRLRVMDHPDNERKKLSESYAGQAVNMLRQAVDHGAEHFV